MSEGPTGLLCVDKPAGPTSHDVVARARRELGVRRIGHAGTLDPFATGLLLLGVGRATRLLRFLADTDKQYEGTLALGTATDTLDATGRVTRTVAMDVDPADVAAAARALTGTLDQVPPMVSALHHEGRRLHELAREGVVVERAPRRVHVAAFDVEAVDAQHYRFGIECSSGTYVRVLVDDLGHALGGAAHVVTLRRTRVGRFRVDDAVTLGPGVDLVGALRPPASMVAHLEALEVTQTAARALARGQRVAAADGPDGLVAVLEPDGELVCVARRAAGTLHAEVVVWSGPTGADG